ncbi:MAG TPA: hypothetical protein VGG33_00130 [Polyangia bacterium]
MSRRTLLGLLVVSAWGCASTPPPPPPRATITIVCSVSDASVWVDDRYAGPASAWAKGNTVLAGFRRIEVRHPDHFSFFAEVTPKAGETLALSPVLRPLLD